MALLAVEQGHLATIVTALEMTERPKPAPVATSPLRLTRWKAPAPDKYRLLFRRVGEPWLWFSRLAMSDAELAPLLADPATEIFAVCDPKGIEVGLVELDFRTPGLCHLAFFGLIPPLAGQGLGRWLMGQALMLGWRKGIERMTVQTCTLDHAGALPFYLKAGFRAVSRTIETFPDPRLAGLLDPEAAPQVPIIG